MADTLADAQYKQATGVGSPAAQPVSGTVAISGTPGVMATPLATATALLAFKIISAATTNGASIKATAGRLYTCYAQNTTASWKFIKFYNKASAPTVGTDTPVVTLGIPPNGFVSMDDPYPIAFATGLAVAVTGLSPDADTTATAVGDVLATIGYI